MTASNGDEGPPSAASSPAGQSEAPHPAPTTAVGARSAVRDGGQDDWVRDVGELLRVLAATDIEELEVEQDGTRVLVRRDLTTGAFEPEMAVAPSDADAADAYTVTSPVVGVFRRSSGAKNESAVDEGDLVAAGQVVGAIEAMGIMHRVQSERAGVVDKLLVQDGQPIEYGQPLMVLRAP